jgi:hypothetical protein
VCAAEVRTQRRAEDIRRDRATATLTIHSHRPLEEAVREVVAEEAERLLVFATTADRPREIVFAPVS